ncbi:MAG: HD domain-containing protein [Desulfonatronovibrionaceae bacterium]
MPDASNRRLDPLNGCDLGAFEEYFEAYYRSLTLNDADDPNLLLKRDHSRNVSRLACRLALEEKFPKETVFLAGLSGLFHDVGRFEQYRRFKTFKDSESVDHARLGALIIRKMQIFSSLSRSDFLCLKTAVLLHNKMKLPQGLPEQISRVTRAVRDADKLDIFPIMIQHFSAKQENSAVVTLGLDPAEACSPAMVESLKAGELGQYAAMRYVNDFKLLLCSWVYDLNYDFSRQRVLGKRYIQTLFELLPQEPEMDRLKRKTLDYLGKRCS